MRVEVKLSKEVHRRSCTYYRMPYVVHSTHSSLWRLPNDSDQPYRPYPLACPHLPRQCLALVVLLVVNDFTHCLATVQTRPSCDRSLWLNPIRQSRFVCRVWSTDVQSMI